MAYTTGLLKHRVTILNRREAQQGRFGLDSAGVRRGVTRLEAIEPEEEEMPAI